MDKAADLKLIADNWETLLPAAELAFEEQGRGTLLVDTTRIENGGYPFKYVGLTSLPNDDADCGRMVRTYNPERNRGEPVQGRRCRVLVPSGPSW